MARHEGDVVIVGAGIGGLALALSLHRHGIRSRIFETVPEIKPLGVGINLLPHATRALTELGVIEALEAIAVETRESAFFNRFGQLIYREPAGRFAGWAYPQLSIHRGDLQLVLLAAVRERLGAEAVVTGVRCERVDQDARGVTLVLRDTLGGGALPSVHGSIAIACDGIHSVVRKQFYPHEGGPVYSGVNMWRGTTIGPPMLTGASMVRAGWLAQGKMVIYPIRDNVDGAGNQLINWVAEVATPKHIERDWNREGSLDDFIEPFADWHFAWLDTPAMIRAAERVLEYPMVDCDPLPRWSFDRITLLGDAAHPMIPRGSNGSAQALLDAMALGEILANEADPIAALDAYDRLRRETANAVVLRNRTQPPDAIIREVWERTGDRPFGNIDDVISPAEIKAIADGYRTVVGVDASLAAK